MASDKDTFEALVRAFTSKTKIDGVEFAKDYKTPRVIFTTSKKGKHTNMTDLCNGLIMSTDTYEVLARQPPTLRIVPELKYTNNKKNIIYSAVDGTSITLYYYDNRWCIATARAWDVSDKYPHGADITYQTALNQVIDTISFDLNELDKSCSYSFVLAHPEMHPLSIYSLTHIATYRGLERVNETRACSHKKVDDIDMTRGTIKEYLDTGIPNFGYIMWTSTARYYVESELMNYIRNLLYANIVVKERMHNKYDRAKYASLLAVVRANTNPSSEYFPLVFPAWAEYYSAVKLYCENNPDSARMDNYNLYKNIFG